MKKKKILDEKRLAKKKAKNAITALGHFLTLVIQVRGSYVKRCCELMRVPRLFGKKRKRPKISINALKEIALWKIAHVRYFLCKFRASAFSR